VPVSRQALESRAETEFLDTVRREIERLKDKITVAPIGLLQPGGAHLLPSDSAALTQTTVQDVCQGRTFQTVLPELGVTVTLGVGYRKQWDEYRRQLREYEQRKVEWQAAQPGFWGLVGQILSRQQPAPIPPPPLPPRIDSQTAASPQEAAALDSAQKVLRDATVRQRICAALHSVRDDLHEIYKPLVKILIPVGTLSPAAAAFAGLEVPIGPIQVTAVWLATVSIIIARAGIKSVCANLESGSR
jgi:hypothetical protein